MWKKTFRSTLWYVNRLKKTIVAKEEVGECLCQAISPFATMLFFIYSHITAAELEGFSHVYKIKNVVFRLIYDL